MYCGKCGNKVPDGAKFCNLCGHQLPERKVKPVATPEIAPEEPIYQPAEQNEAPVYAPYNDSQNEYVAESVEEPAYQPADDYYEAPEAEPIQQEKPVKQKKQKQQKPKKKGKAGVVVAIILVLALAAGAVWWFFLGGKDMIGKNQIEISEEVLDEIIELDDYEDFDDPVKVTYAKVTDTEEYELLGIDCKDEYITVKGENKYVTFETGYIAAYYDEDGEWVLDKVRRNDEYESTVAPKQNISEEDVKLLVCKYLGNNDLRFDDISIDKFDEDERKTEAELTVTGEIDGEYVTADAEASFGLTPDGWYIWNVEITDKRDAEESEETDKPESDSPIPIETERNETMPPETEVVETPETEASQGLKYKVDGDGIGITSVGTCTDKNIVIPAEIDGKPVTYIGEFAFHNCEFIETVTMPDTVTTINQSAFYECVNLKTVDFPDNLTIIAEQAFYNCTSLIGVDFPDSVFYINNNAFYGCSNLVNVNFSDSIQHIGNNAFANCDLISSLDMPKSLVLIGNGCFASCDSLVSVTLNYGLMTIGESAFSSCPNLAEINIPDSVETIGEYAFFQCDSLKQITIPSGAYSIGREVFAYCDNLESIYCDMKSKPGGWEFGWLGHASPEVIWQGDYNIIDSGECGDNLTWTLDTSYTLTISGTGEMDEWIGKDCAEWAQYYSASIVNVVIEDGVTSIGESMLGVNDHGSYDNLQSITIPDSVTKIGDCAFNLCEKLEQITIPSSVVEMGYAVFAYLPELTDIYCGATTKPTGWSDEWNEYCNATVHWGYGANTPETEAPQTTPPETEAPVVSDPKATLRVPAGYEVAVFTHDSATGKTIIIAKNTSDKLYYILDTNGNRLINTGYDSYSNIAAPYFGNGRKIYKYNFSKNVMEDVVRDVYERLMVNAPSDIYYNKEMDLLVTVNEEWKDEWDKYNILDSRYNEQYWEMQISLLDSHPRVGTYETREALKNNGNPYNMIGHTPVVVKRCSFSTSRMRLIDNFKVQMVIDNFSTTNKYGVVGTNIPFDYDELYAYAPEWSPIWYVAKMGSDWGVIDGNNVQVIKFKYGDIMVFANPDGYGFKLYAVVSKIANGKKVWGVVDEDGNTVVPFEYEQIVPINFTTELKQYGCLGVANEGYTNENLEFYVKKNGSWSAISAR